MEKKGFLKSTVGKVILGIIILVIGIGVGAAVSLAVKGLPNNANVIGEEKAKNIALEHAQIKESDTTRIRVHLDYDDGITRYEVEFYSNQQEYDYEIDAETGDVLTYDGQIHKQGAANTTNTENVTNSENKVDETFIGEEKAKEIAAAKVPGVNIADIFLRMEREDGRKVYDGSFVYNNMEYDFTIDAVTGAIIEWDED